jgi:putative SOS response-associated peptidase YedK
MCGGIEFQGTKVFFPNPEARLPVRTRDGGVTWLPWGSRNRMDHSFPNGGWARLESIKQGKWKAWHPRPVLIGCDRFMEKDAEGVTHWFDMEAHMVIQGLVAERNQKQLVYVVTEPPPPEYAWIHDRYPRLVRLGS